MKTNYFEEGVLHINREHVNVESLEWNPSPVYKGVSLKHLIKGENTNNQLSCHLVKIEPNCEIALHNHAGKTELHEVLQGYGVCKIKTQQLNYNKGVVTFIPADENHLVKAGDDGLVLLAKFFPALL